MGKIANRDISVIIPARNAADTLRETIDSVLNQDGLLEVVVVDDASEDATCSVCEAFRDQRLRVLRTSGVGIARALNLGFREARGAFIARCDADDLYTAGRLKWQRALLSRRPDLVAVSSGYRTITETGNPVADLACEGEGRDVTSVLREGRAITSFCTWLMRAQALRACGGARPWFITGEDLDLQFRLAGQGSVWHEPAVGYAYRLHERSITHMRSRAFNEFYETQARIFARQRATGGIDDLAKGRPPAVPDGIAGSGARNAAARHVSDQLHGQAWRLFDQRGLRHGLPAMLRAPAHAPADMRKWRSLAVMMVKGILLRGGRTNAPR